MSRPRPSTSPRVGPSPPEQIRIDQMVPGGQGMGRMEDGRTAFVAGAVAGDFIEVLAMHDKKSYIQVTDFRMLTPSDDRVVARCEVADKCGGCDWMVLSGSAQQKHKLSVVEQALVRTGRVQLENLEKPVSFHGSEQSFNYRSRVRLQVAGGQLGFYSPQSHRLVTFKSCEVASRGVQKIIELLRPVVAAQHAAFSCVKAIEIRVLQPDHELSPEHASIHLVVGTGQEQPTHLEKNALLAALAPLAERAQVRIGRDQSNLQSFLVPSFDQAEHTRIMVAPGGFTQVNLGVNSEIVRRVLKESEGARTFLDIYCGSGNFSLPLIAHGLQGVGVELSQEAIGAAELGAEQGGLSGEFFAGSSERVLSDFVRHRRRFDLVLVDPPRAGAKPIIEALKTLVLKKLVMISCDPVTLARDIQALTTAGFTLQTVSAYDMFPQTHHVETVAILTPAAATPID